MAAATHEIVAVELRLIDRFTKKMRHINKGFNSVKQRLGGFNKVMKMGQPQWRNYNQAIGMTGKEFTRFAQGMPTKELMKGGLIVDKLGTFHNTLNGELVSNTQAQQTFTKRVTGGFKGMGNRMRMATHGMRGFRMEMLGVMFFGMMIQRIFRQLLNPAMEVYGVFELFSIMLMVLFLPIMQTIYPYILDFFNWVVGLSPETKKLIGWIALLGLVIGTALFAIGSIALGMGSVIGAGLFPLVVLLTLIAAALAFVAIAWINDWNGMRQSVADFLGWFVGIYNTWIKPLLGMLIISFYTAFHGVIAAFKIIPARFKLIFLYLKKAVRMGWNGILTIFEDSVNGALDSVKFFLNGFIHAYNLIAGIMGKQKIAKLEYGTFSVDKKGYLALDQQIQEQKDIIDNAATDMISKSDASIDWWMEKVNAGTGVLEKLAKKSQDLAIPSIKQELEAEGGGLSIKEQLDGVTNELSSANGTEVNISNEYNVSVVDKAELEKLFEEHDMQLLKDIVDNTS